MSRLSMRAYLSAARRYLQKVQREKTHASFVIGNESADLDSLTCALIYGYILSERPEVKRSGNLIIPVANLPAADLQLRPELTALLRHADIKPSELITLDDLGTEPLPAPQTDWTLVDHNSLQGKLGQIYTSRVSGVIDHHDDEHAVPEDANPRIIIKSGSCQSLVINHLRETWQKISDSAMTVGAAHPQNNEKLVDDQAYTSNWDAQVAKLALGAILIDTVKLKAEHKVTEHDKRAVRFLEAKINISRKYGKDYDRDKFFTEIDDAKSDLDALSLVDILRKDYKQWEEGGLTLGISSCVKPCEYLIEKEKDFQVVLKKFANERSLDLFAIMPAFKGKDEFERQLLVMALNDKGKEAVERFTKNGKEELKLKEQECSALTEDSEIALQRLWDQKNLDASRKRVAPLMREAMKG